MPPLETPQEEIEISENWTECKIILNKPVPLLNATAIFLSHMGNVKIAIEENTMIITPECDNSGNRMNPAPEFAKMLNLIKEKNPEVEIIFS